MRRFTRSCDCLFNFPVTSVKSAWPSRAQLLNPIFALSLFYQYQTSTALGQQDMSAHYYNRIPPAPAQAPALRRHPLSNATVNQGPAQASLGKPQEAVKAPSSPPLPRQNTKTAPPSPPKIITDRSRAVEYHRIGFLGEVSRTHFRSRFV